jgi:hypothetical protein
MHHRCAFAYLVNAPEMTAYNMMVQIFDFVLHIRGFRWGLVMCTTCELTLRKRSAEETTYDKLR